MLPEPIRHLIRNFLAGNPFRGEPDDAVWAAVRTGDRADPAFGQALCVLLERAGGPVYAVCRRHLGPGADAEDVFQDAVVALIRRPPRRVGTFAQARAWLCKVARNKAVDRLNQRHAAGPLADDTAVAAADPSPDDRLDAVMAAVARLKEKYRVPFQLAAIDGLTAEAIGGRLGLTAEAAQKRVERARGMVLRTLAGRGVAPAAAGAALQSTLTEVGRAAMPPDRAATLTEAILARLAALPAVRTVTLKAAAVLLAGLTVGGVGVAGWAATREPAPESAQVPPPEPESPVPAAPVRLETVAERNLRVFHAEVLPVQLGLLREVALGGEVELVAVEAFDSRVECVFRIHYRSDGEERYTSGLRFTHDASNHFTGVRFDLYGRGEWKVLNTRGPFVGLWNPLTGVEVMIPPPPGFEAARRAFERLPQDDRTLAQARAHADEMRAAVTPFLGTWYDCGDPARRVVVRLYPDGWLHTTRGTGQPGTSLIGNLRIRPGGWIDALPYTSGPVRLSADGQRAEFAGHGEWWSREPTAPAK